MLSPTATYSSLNLIGYAVPLVNNHHKFWWVWLNRLRWPKLQNQCSPTPIVLITQYLPLTLVNV